MRGSSSYSHENLFDALESPPGSPPGSPSRPQQEQITTEEVVFGSTNLTLYHFNPSKLDSLSINQRKLDARYEDNVTKAKKKRLMFEELSTDASKAKDRFDERETLVLPGDTVNLYRFVILRNGRMVCGQNYQDEAYSHENLADGDGVLAAGEFGFNTSGSLRYVSNRTGHYRVAQKVLIEVVFPCLEAHGCTVKDLQQLYVRFCSSGAPEGSEPAQSFLDYKNLSSFEPARHKALQKSFRLAKKAAAQDAGGRAKKKQRTSNTAAAPCLISNLGSSSLLFPPGSSFSFRADHASAGGLFGASAGGLFGAGAGGLFDAGAGGLFDDSLNDERGQSSYQGASNQSEEVSALFDPPSLR